ncbi:SLAM family member 5-like [Scomber japonicus]|uniref:SLAM family member 5-like n=1 Tax=Scomber japonicus TaxID=13676 RepID=UPI00230699F1|nr:SLAM family member 5-like [Scomber japonicus]
MCVLFTGSSAVTTVFVQKGKDLHLDVNNTVVIPEFDEFRWRFNGTHSIVRLSPDERTRITDSYKGRVEFYVQNHSLLLKNVQHSDSGGYTALITGDTTQLLTEYKVIIQDPVSPVNLSVNPVSNSRESCNLTVTCSTEDSLINSTFTCDNQTCHQEGEEQSEVTTSGSSLLVYLLNDSIICNHSNQISRTTDMMEIWPLCYPTADQRKRKKTMTIENNTLYATPEDLNQIPNQTATDDASDLSPNTTYATVGKPTRPVQSTQTENTTKPETIYAQVNKGPKSNHQLKNTDDLVPDSKDQIVVCHDGF